ncbi:hypothetical protein [Methylobacterium nonmethylotrophicum]|uniref:Uncharacterized protein n=1 Tax=Methylobacterium nonmethylotrophicum TaxID=1141884 RepID=A0A4Z0NKK7_9HYPH|nr:hypothetical protein [Methylobacterium nonmethylotrophicum]TGD96751.1 hypothetical protein EU555_22070 [Methylobacterium nonmethylotrophicum]
MSDVAFETDRRNSAEFKLVPQTEEQHADTGELSLDELDEANGGLLLLVAAFAGAVGYRMYLDYRGWR